MCVGVEKKPLPVARQRPRPLKLDPGGWSPYNFYHSQSRKFSRTMLTTCVAVQYVHASKSLASKPFGFSGFVRLNYFKWKPAYQRRKDVQMNASFEGRKVNDIIPEEKISGLRDVNESLCEEKISGDSIMELTNMAALALAGKKQEETIDCTKNRQESDVPVDAFRLGRLVEGNLLYRQTYVIRSYEETASNHFSSNGPGGDGFGTTPEMRRRNLISVVSRMQVQVDRYPSWCDVVEVDTWLSPSGKNRLRRDWCVRDYKSGHILTQATSTWVAMNSETRRLSKVPEEVKEEIQPFTFERRAVLADDAKKLHKLDYEIAQCIRSDLTLSSIVIQTTGKGDARMDSEQVWMETAGVGGGARTGLTRGEPRTHREEGTGHKSGQHDQQREIGGLQMGNEERKDERRALYP
eukprot:Gb_35712 [translate_table: standard]